MDHHDDDPQPQMTFVLFVAGDSPRSRQARASVTRAFEARGLAPQEVRIIDALADPEQALAHRIVGVPTLMTSGWASRVYIFDAPMDEQRLEHWLDKILNPEQAQNVAAPTDISEGVREPGDAQSVRDGDRE